MSGILPDGYRFTMIAVAMLKRAVLDEQTPPADRVRFLEGMSRWIDVHFTEEMLRMIEPAGDTECQIVHEVMSLDRGREISDRIVSGTLNILTSERVFSHICTLNPSIPAAIKLRDQSWSKPNANQSE